MTRHTPFALALLLAASLAFPQFSHAQNWGVGMRAMFNGGPTGLSVTRHLSDTRAIEGYFGHSKLNGEGLFQSGSWVLGANYQPRVNVGSRQAGSGFYANLGGRFRIHNNILSAPAEQTNFRQTQSVSLEAVAGGGVFVRLGDQVEVFGELNVLFGNVSGFGGYGLNADTGVGFRYLFY